MSSSHQRSSRNDYQSRASTHPANKTSNIMTGAKKGLTEQSEADEDESSDENDRIGIGHQHHRNRQHSKKKKSKIIEQAADSNLRAKSMLT